MHGQCCSCWPKKRKGLESHHVHPSKPEFARRVSGQHANDPLASLLHSGDSMYIDRRWQSVQDYYTPLSFSLMCFTIRLEVPASHAHWQQFVNQMFDQLNCNSERNMGLDLPLLPFCLLAFFLLEHTVCARVFNFCTSNEQVPEVYIFKRALNQKKHALVCGILRSFAGFCARFAGAFAHHFCMLGPDSPHASTNC